MTEAINKIVRISGHACEYENKKPIKALESRMQNYSVEKTKKENTIKICLYFDLPYFGHTRWMLATVYWDLLFF